MLLVERARTLDVWHAGRCLGHVIQMPRTNIWHSFVSAPGCKNQLVGVKQNTPEAAAKQLFVYHGICAELFLDECVEIML
jgi:hypothetical protein